MAEDEPIREFGRRKPVAPSPASPPKRSGHVALLLMGTLAVGGGAYALMPDGCEPPSAAMAAPGASQNSGGCFPHGSSGGFYSRSSHFFGGDSSGPGSSATSSDAASSGVSRGGFGSFPPAASARSGKNAQRFSEKIMRNQEPKARR
jgi:hypothetical protein